jgi:hypothetical protein
VSDEPVDPEVDRSGIHVPRELADAEGVPIDLDANVGDSEWGVPSPIRRRTAGWLYLGGAMVAGIGALVGLGSGLWIGVVGLGVLAAVHFLAAWPLEVDEQAALRASVREVPFAVGHASAAVRFSGWRSRPVWHVIVYDASEPPAQRALIRVDGVTGDLVGGTYVEAT